MATYAQEHLPRIVGTLLALLSLAILIIFWWKHTFTDIVLLILLFIVGWAYAFSERFAHHNAYHYILLAITTFLELYVFYKLVLFLIELFSYYTSDYSAYYNPIVAPHFVGDSLGNLTNCRLYLLEPGIPRHVAQNILPSSVGTHYEDAIVSQNVFLMTATWLGCVVDIVSFLTKLALLSLLGVAMMSMLHEAKRQSGEHKHERMVITHESPTARTYGGTTQVSHVIEEH